MMDIKIIKTVTEHEAALRRIEALMDAEPGSPKEEELELLVLLVEKYESQHYPIELPDPVEAIKFRMEQEGLSNNDLIPYLGSQSKVSEVLNYKRPLSLSMIRSLHEGLGIQAEVLIQESIRSQKALWSPWSDIELTSNAYTNFPIGNDKHLVSSLQKWQSSTTNQALKLTLPQFNPENLDRPFVREIVRLGSYSAGPQMARELLNKNGIHFIVHENKSKYELDGACFFTPDNQPVIAMTLRNDRLDDFWFTLLHLLGHLYLIRNDKSTIIFDSLQKYKNYKEPPQEKQVNQWLRKVLMSEKQWQPLYDAYLETGRLDTLEKGAHTLGTSPEIISCMLRLEREASNVELDIELLPSRKISKKLEVYG